MQSLDARGVVLTERLQHEAGKDQREDGFICGYIAAIKDFLQVDLEEIKES